MGKGAKNPPRRHGDTEKIFGIEEQNQKSTAEPRTLRKAGEHGQEKRS
jgi:hypothetical protein